MFFGEVVAKNIWSRKPKKMFPDESLKLVSWLITFFPVFAFSLDVLTPILLRFQIAVKRGMSHERPFSVDGEVQSGTKTFSDFFRIGLSSPNISKVSGKVGVFDHILPIMCHWMRLN